jgi:hypothetical protein
VGAFYLAEVCVTRGWLWWKTTETWTIIRQVGANWVFANTWCFTPGYQAETLERGYLLEQQLAKDRMQKDDGQ